MRRTLPLCPGVLAALVAMGAACSCGLRDGPRGEGGAEEAIKIPARTSRNAAGETVVTMDRATQQRVGLETEPLAARSLTPETVAYGRLQEDPAAIFVLRAPSDGTLRRAPNRDWPSLGEMVADGVVVGSLEARLTGVDRLNLADRLASAQADESSASASLTAARAALDRARTLNAEGKNVSDRAVQEAEARVRIELARARAASETVSLLRGSLSTGAGVETPLTAARGGEVVESLAQPGEAVVSGQPILRLARFESLIARVEVPAAQHATAVSSARILVLGREDRPLHGDRIAAGAATDPHTQGQAFLFRVANPGLLLRPGTAVTAYLQASGRSVPGVAVPDRAVVRLAGKLWVYVQTGAEQFTRKEIPEAAPAGGGWFAAMPAAAGQRVVVTGAQVLLSEESKGQIQVEGEGPGD